MKLIQQYLLGAAAKSLQSCPTLCGQVCRGKAEKKISSLLRNVTRNSSGNYTIVLKVDGIGSDCIYSSSCLKPKKFQLKVDRYGHITPGDALSEAYLLNKTKLINKKADLEKAATLLPNYTTE